MRRHVLAVIVLVVVALTMSATVAGAANPPKTIGKGEGSLSILAWPGYAEDGSTQADKNWVGEFEQQTGCQTTVKTFGTSDEAFTLFHTGQYDVVSASGDSYLRSVVNGDAAPINTKLVKTFKDFAKFLVNRPEKIYKGKLYGVPQGWGANLLLYNENVVKPAPTSWSVAFDKTSPYSGKITAYDSPIYIADAALYLMKTKPALKIKDPYALDPKQFNAAVSLLKQQKQNIGEYWSDYLKEQSAFTKGSTVLGQAWQYQTNLIQADKASPPVKAIVPKEGSTAWFDNWQVYAKTKHVNCAYKWLNFVTSPKTQALIADWFGEAPANLKACGLPPDPNACKTYGAQDKSFYSKLYYWKTPTAKCLDGRTNVKCEAYKDWAAAWDVIKGS